MSYILVTGGLGFIGSHTVIELLENNFNVIIIDNLINSSKDIFQKIKNITNISDDYRLVFYEIDIKDTLKLENLFENYKIDVVIHFASLKAVSESIKNPIEYYDNNITGTLNLLKIMKKYNSKKIIFSSSATVYGNNDYPVDEQSLTGNGITNPYGKTKYMLEQILKDIYLSDNTWSIILLRYFNPIGAHPSAEIGENPNDIPNNLFPYLLKVSTGKLDQLNIFGKDYDTEDGTCIRDFIHVVDLARGHIKSLNKILNTAESKLDIYNLGTGKGTSVLNLINIFEKVNKIKLNYKFIHRREGDLPIVFAKTEKSFIELDWKCDYTIEDMCIHGYKFIKQLEFKGL